MKKRIVTAVITACLALCAAVWPQPDTREERPAPIPTHAAAAPKADVVTTAERKKRKRHRQSRTRSLAPFLSPHRQGRCLRSKRRSRACASHTAADHRAAARR